MIGSCYNLTLFIMDEEQTSFIAFLERNSGENSSLIVFVHNITILTIIFRGMRLKPCCRENSGHMF